MRVKFIENRQMHDAHGKVVQDFKCGEVVDFTDRPDQAQRWLRRNAAVIFDEKAEKKANAAAKESGSKDSDGGDANGADDAGKGKVGAAASGSKR